MPGGAKGKPGEVSKDFVLSFFVVFDLIFMFPLKKTTKSLKRRLFGWFCFYSQVVLGGFG